MLQLLLSTVNAQTTNLQLNQNLINVWYGLLSEAKSISDKDCSGEIVAAFDNANSTYNKYGLGHEFIDSVYNIQTVAGDIPEADKFRSNLGNLTSSIKIAFQQVAKPAIQNASPVSPAKPAVSAVPEEKLPGYHLGPGGLANSATVDVAAWAIIVACGILL